MKRKIMKLAFILAVMFAFTGSYFTFNYENVYAQKLAWVYTRGGAMREPKKKWD